MKVAPGEEAPRKSERVRNRVAPLGSSPNSSTKFFMSLPAPKAVDEAVKAGLTEFPCRCGEIHKGDYGIYDFGHHMCFHDVGLCWLLGPQECPDPKEWSLMCPICGMVFDIIEEA